MGYRTMGERNLWEVYRRWRAGQSLSRIAREESWDRKTIRAYLKRFEAAGLRRNDGALDFEGFQQRMQQSIPVREGRGAPRREDLQRHEQELRELISREKEPLKPKTAFLVVKSKYELDLSYETFKRFAREQRLSRKERRQMIRIELPAGKETQLDYGRVGTLVDPVSGKERVVYAFCAVLAHSRLPHIEFVRTQEQTSFATSVVTMIHAYGGVTEWISIDNLKAGVIKPDLWDPTINRALAEVADYYGLFINTCRVARPTDKGKVERGVPVARELFRMLKELHPTEDLGQLNERARQWCREVYGGKEHGTTGVPPIEAFEQERQTLKAIPEERYEVAVWKQATVHPGDQFVSFQRRRFSLPPQWRGRTVWLRCVEPVVRLYDGQGDVIRQYVLRPGVQRYWLPEDFPEGVREMMDGGYPAWLIQKAEAYGQEARGLICSVLRPHAYLNARRARGMLDILAAHYGKSYFQDVCVRATRRCVSLPQTLRRMMEAAQKQPLWQTELPISVTGTQMVRDIRYYVDTETRG